MKSRITPAAAWIGAVRLSLLVLVPGALLATPVEAQELPRVVIQTDLGDIEVDIDSVRAPITAANFLRYVDLGFYRVGRFHRTVRADNQPDSKIKLDVVQAGLDSLRVKDFPPIPLERTSVTKLQHKDGTISMARDGPNTATSDFFICVGDQPALDFGGKRNPDGQGFAAFGRVVLGMDVVRKIHAAPAEGQTLEPAVRILNIVRKQGSRALPAEVQQASGDTAR
ncbi:MAG TPA: peptidylprolyl isomerase [Gemmatimonadales bacterium]|nr:peptidylprolyl isomerase [Gemmatimonadales bacterium]